MQDYQNGVEACDVAAWTLHDICNLIYEDKQLIDDLTTFRAFVFSFYDLDKGHLRPQLLIIRFNHLMYNIVENLCFNQLNKTEDFFAWASNMSGTNDSLYETVPNNTLDKYFPGYIERLDNITSNLSIHF
jgi:hypothetical protein